MNVTAYYVGQRFQSRNGKLPRSDLNHFLGAIAEFSPGDSFNHETAFANDGVSQTVEC